VVLRFKLQVANKSLQEKVLPFMLKNTFIRLSKTQQEVLEILHHGSIMTIDRMNMASIGHRNVAPNTRYFLTNNKLIIRKDKTKSVTTKGNGYIISAKGLQALNDNRKINRRGTSSNLLKEKKCGRCKIVKPISSFVSIYGFENPRGKYCYDCFLSIQQEHALSLMEGRNFCLYCGIIIYKAYDWTKDGKSVKTYLHRDHMNPLSLGGEDNDHNTVYCCTSCNIKKGGKTFIEWLKILNPKYSTLAREVYIQKHNYIPEDFKPSMKEIVFTLSKK